MNIALGICCLVVLVILDGASVLSEEQSSKEYQNESTLRAKKTKRACKRHGGKCRPIRPGSIYDGQLLTGEKYCSNERDGCYVPAFDPTRCPNIKCKKDMRPVCASDDNIFKTFDNLCFLMKAVACNQEDANMKWQHNGKCNLSCPVICLDYWEPICVGTPNNRRLETFSNIQCFEEEVRCNPAYEDFVFKHNGPCICKIQKIRDVGVAILPRYYYDWDLQECLEFIYGGGRDENTNRFLTYDDCYETCARWIANETTVQPTTAQ